MSLLGWIYVILVASLASEYGEGSSYLPSDLMEDYGKFAEHLFQTIANKTQGNFAVSPFSLAQILNVILYGTGGNTQTQIMDVLHVPHSSDVVANASRELIQLLKKEKDVEWVPINIVLVDRMYRVSNVTQHAIREYFDAVVKNPDFSEVNQLVKSLNDYIERTTNNTIKNMMSEDVIGPNTAMISLNVLYFKGPLISFRNDYFLIDYTLPDHKIKKVRVFPSYETHKWYGNLDFESVSIQLKNKKFAMIIAMPKRPGDFSTIPPLPELLKLINGSNLASQAVIPRFVIDSELDSKSILQTMGLKDIFLRDADFSGFSVNHGLHLSSVIHKTHINVTHESVGAAAATVNQADPQLRRVHRFRDSSCVYVERPFLVHIVYESLPLFSLRVIDPDPWV